jgi:hypothetical protein
MTSSFFFHVLTSSFSITMTSPFFLSRPDVIAAVLVVVRFSGKSRGHAISILQLKLLRPTAFLSTTDRF